MSNVLYREPTMQRCALSVPYQDLTLFDAEKCWRTRLEISNNQKKAKPF